MLFRLQKRLPSVPNAGFKSPDKLWNNFKDVASDFGMVSKFRFDNPEAPSSVIVETGKSEKALRRVESGRRPQRRGKAWNVCDVSFVNVRGVSVCGSHRIQHSAKRGRKKLTEFLSQHLQTEHRQAIDDFIMTRIHTTGGTETVLALHCQQPGFHLA